MRGDVACHAAQAVSQIDAEIGGIDHFWMETNYIPQPAFYEGMHINRYTTQ